MLTLNDFVFSGHSNYLRNTISYKFIIKLVQINFRIKIIQKK